MTAGATQTTALPITTEKQLRDRLALLGTMSDEQRNSVICALIGHSNIQTGCFGYFSCGRCDYQLGDTLGGVYSLENVVIVGHDCPKCRENFAKLDWRSLLYAKNPFPDGSEGSEGGEE